MSQCIQRVVDILEKHHKAGDELAVVVSATCGITNQLIEESPPPYPPRRTIPPLLPTVIRAFSKRHITTLEGAAPDLVGEVGAVVEEQLIRLQNVHLCDTEPAHSFPPLKGLRHIDGERLLAPILLRGPPRGIASTVMDGCEDRYPRHPPARGVHDTNYRRATSKWEPGRSPTREGRSR